MNESKWNPNCIMPLIGVVLSFVASGCGGPDGVSTDKASQSTQPSSMASTPSQADAEGVQPMLPGSGGAITPMAGTDTVMGAGGGGGGGVGQAAKDQARRVTTQAPAKAEGAVPTDESTSN